MKLRDTDQEGITEKCQGNDQKRNEYAEKGIGGQICSPQW